MTPDTIALSRALTSHERWPHLAPSDTFHTFGTLRTVRADDTGLLWRWLDGAWTLDLGDAATGGVLLGLFVDGVEHEDLPGLTLWPRQLGGWCLSMGTPRRGPSLGHAAAEALLALWGAA